MKERFLRYFRKLYCFVFKDEMNSSVKAFLKSFSWSFIGGTVSSATLVFISILAGRLLGPTEYGKYNFIAAVSQIILVIVIFGMDKSSMRFIAQTKNEFKKAQYLSSALRFVVLISIAVSVVYLMVYKFLANYFNVPPFLLLMALLYGLCISFRQIFNNFLRGLHDFKFQSVARIIESFFILALFATLFYFVIHNTYSIYMYSLIGGYVLFVVISIYKLKSYFVSFNTTIFREQFSFAKIYCIALILGAVFGSLDKIVIGKYMSFYDLGIYGAYSAAALNLTSQLGVIFGNVFFPTVSKNLSKIHLILRKVDKLSLMLFLPLLFLTMVGTTIIMILFGSSYPLKAAYIISFSLLGILNLIFSGNAMIVDVYSKKSLKTAMILGNSSNVIFAGLFLLLVRTFGITIQLVVSVLMLYTIVEIAICKYALYRHGAYSPLYEKNL